MRDILSRTELYKRPPLFALSSHPSASVVLLPGGGVPWAHLGVPNPDVRPTSREAVMDRMHQHTAQCTTCTAALEQTRTAQKSERLWIKGSYPVFF